MSMEYDIVAVMVAALQPKVSTNCMHENIINWGHTCCITQPQFSGVDMPLHATKP